jgi:hypothetical protein
MKEIHRTPNRLVGCFSCAVVFLGMTVWGPLHAATTARVRAASELNTDDPAVIARAYAHPKIDPAKQLKGIALVTALRRGGFNLFMRHTQTGTVTAQCTTSNLSPAGERDAKFVGDSMRSLRIPIDRVLSSPICRVLDTAKLLNLGEVDTTFELSNVPSESVPNLEQARLRLLLTAPPTGKNRMLVSHLQHGKAEQDRLALDFGEIIVVAAGANNTYKAVARIRADDWYDLIETNRK